MSEHGKALTDSARASSSASRNFLLCLCLDLLVWLLRGAEVDLLAAPELLEPLLRWPRPSVAKKALVCDE